MGNFTQRGQASQEMTDAGFVAAHPSLPLKTNIRVKNIANNKEVNVKITNRVGVSSSRIIDLSPAAYNALGLKKGDIVSISVNPPPASVPVIRVVAVDNESPSPQVIEIVQPPTVVVAQPSVVQSAVPVQTVSVPPDSGTTITSSPLPGINVVVTNSAPVYPGKETSQNERIIVVNPTPSSQSNTAYLAWLMAMTVEAREARAAREEREVREARETREARTARFERDEREEREYREAREAREARAERLEREEREAREYFEEQEVW